MDKVYILDEKIRNNPGKNTPNLFLRQKVILIVEAFRQLMNQLGVIQGRKKCKNAVNMTLSLDMTLICEET